MQEDNFNPDLTQPNDFETGTDEHDTDEQDEQLENQPIEKDEDIIGSISQELGESTNEQEEEIVNEEPVNTFDFSKFSREQIQQLKAMLNATPDNAIRKKKGNAKMTLREVNGKIVVDFKDTFLALTDDLVNGRKVETLIIPVKFHKEEEYTNIPYKEFMKENNRVVCEVLGTNRKINEEIEGETISAETGRLTDMVVTKVEDWFTVKLPNGETVELPVKLLNA